VGGDCINITHVVYFHKQLSRRKRATRQQQPNMLAFCVTRRPMRCMDAIVPMNTAGMHMILEDVTHKFKNKH